MQTAFVLPLSMPLVAPVVWYRADWFFPAMTVLLGAHYLPFGTLCGMRSFLVLAAALAGSGLAIALYVPGTFSLGGWVTGALLLAFAGIGFVEARRAQDLPRQAMPPQAGADPSASAPGRAGLA